MGQSRHIDSALAAAAIPNHLPKSKLAFTTNKLLKGAGTGADPTEIDVPTAPNFKFGTYTGNATDARQITVGFLCKFVIIQVQATSSCYTFLVLNPSGSDCLVLLDTDQVSDQSKPYLHSTDGFVLGGASGLTANASGITYKYAAFG